MTAKQKSDYDDDIIVSQHLEDQVFMDVEEGIQQEGKGMQVSFREILPDDRERIQELFEEWFPVEYKDEFYDNLCEKRMMGPQELYTLVATKVTPTKDAKTEEIIACLLGCKLGSQKLNEASRKLLIPGYQPLIQSNVSFTKMSSSSDDLKLDLDDFEKDSTCDGDENDQGLPDVFYIMTLGVVEEYRKQGLASFLVERALEDQIVIVDDATVDHNNLSGTALTSTRVTNDEEVTTITDMNTSTPQRASSKNVPCETVYLHVIITNSAAIRFYEKLGFERLKEITDYYTIDDQKYNCYLYAKFFNQRWHMTSARMILKRLVLAWMKSLWTSLVSSYQYWLVYNHELAKDD